MLACVRNKCVYSDFFDCPKGVKQSCLLSPKPLSFFMNELALEFNRKDRYGVKLMPWAVELFLFSFVDDVTLLSITSVGLQNQLNALKEEDERYVWGRRVV